jgi:hypothetical protein
MMSNNKGGGAGSSVWRFVSISLAIIFFASAVLQFNDEGLDLAIWGSFYSTQGMLALGVVFDQCGYPASAFSMASMCMVVWSVIMIGSSVWVWDIEEFAGAVLGLVSAAYHATIFGKR